MIVIYEKVYSKFEEYCS